MKKVLEFLKTNLIVIKWTIVYFAILWAILWYMFGFDIFSRIHWWKFFHAHLRGFIGMVFGILIYSAIPIYLATTAIIYRTKKPVVKIPLYETIIERIAKMFKKTEPETETTVEQETETQTEPEYPENLPSELRVPFIRMKQRLSLIGSVSVFNKIENDSKMENDSKETPSNQSSEEPESFPLPTDFDIGDSLPDTSVPTFTDINFDEPTKIEKETKIENAITKYFKENNIDYETYNNFIMTDKYIIYTHFDTDFWIMDNETWFAAGKQIDSPIPTLQEMAKNNNLIPVIYFESTNIMDFDGTIKQMNDAGIKTVTEVTEL